MLALHRRADRAKRTAPSNAAECPLPMTIRARPALPDHGAEPSPDRRLDGLPIDGPQHPGHADATSWVTLFPYLSRWVVDPAIDLARARSRIICQNRCCRTLSPAPCRCCRQLVSAGFGSRRRNQRTASQSPTARIRPMIKSASACQVNRAKSWSQNSDRRRRGSRPTTARRRRSSIGFTVSVWRSGSLRSA
jgi:hypothetical protein